MASKSKPKSGRPRSLPGKKKTKPNISLDPGLQEEAKKVAAANELSYSAWVTRAMERQLALDIANEETVNRATRVLESAGFSVVKKPG